MELAPFEKAKRQKDVELNSFSPFYLAISCMQLRNVLVIHLFLTH